jgi:signal transduction histidine kinase
MQQPMSIHALIKHIKAKTPPRLLKIYQRYSLGGKRITLGYGVALLLLGGMGLISHENANQLRQSTQQVNQFQTAIKDLNNIFAALADADYGRRGYYLYNDPAELAIYQTAIQTINPLLAELRQSLGQLPAQQQSLERLEQLITQRLELTEQSIARFQATQRPPTIDDPLNAQIRQNQREMQQIITALRTDVEQALQSQVAQSQANLQSRIFIETMGSVVTLVIFSGVYLLLYRQRRRREYAEMQRRILNHAKELSEMKLQFFSMISHEFRTPLSLILGSSQLLEQTLRLQMEPAKLKHLYRIQSSAKLMTQLLSDVLTIARADAGELECAPTLVEMQSFCLNLIEDFQVFAEAQRSIRFSQRGSATHAKIDERLVYSILSNLLSNALKYSPAESTVYFTLICEPDAVTFEVKDKGIGISPEDQEWLYEPFKRGVNASTITGTGLGLALVKKCLDLHQGEITIQSEIGVGTTVTVTFPQNQPSTIEQLSG